MDYTYTTNDPAKLEGVTAARAAYNARVQAERRFYSDAEYVQYFMDCVAAEWARTYVGSSPAALLARKETELAAERTKNAALETELATKTVAVEGK